MGGPGGADFCVAVFDVSLYWKYAAAAMIAPRISSHARRCEPGPPVVGNFLFKVSAMCAFAGYACPTSLFSPFQERFVCQRLCNA